MLDRELGELQSNLAERTLSAHVEIKISKEVRSRARELFLEGGIPEVYSNHQMHTDGIAWTELSGFMRDLTSPLPVNRQLKGLSVVFATSMINGQQGEELKEAYAKLIGGAEKKGMIPVPVTREIDVIRYGMSRKEVRRELSPLFDNLPKGYGIGFLPEGTVEGGRHPEGKDIENINGMQEVKNNNLIVFYRLANKSLKKLDKWTFYWPVALHGGYRLMQSPRNGKPYFTLLGKISLYAGILGLSFRKIQATLLMPFTDQEIEKDLGSDWMLNSVVFNKYAMERLKPGLPSEAWGVY